MQNQEIYDAINRNIVRHQNPSFQKNLTLMGWCSMNYKAVSKTPMSQITQSTSNRVFNQEEYQKMNKQIEDKLSNLYQNFKDQDYCSKINKPFQKVLDKNVHGTNQRDSLQNIGQHSLSHVTTIDLEKQSEIKRKMYYSKDQYQQYQPVDAEIDYLKRKKLQPFAKQQPQQSTLEKEFSSTQQQNGIPNYPNYVITEQSLVEILNPTLTLLNLNNHTNISQKMFGLISQYSPNLITLNLSQTQITNDILQKINESCKQLRNIDLSRCDRITGLGLQKFIEQNINLEKINLENCSSDIVNDESLIHLNKCLNLEELIINYCRKLSDQFLQSLVNLKKIKVFCVSSCENFTSQTLVQIIKNNLENLTIVDISFIECANFNHIIQKLTLCQNMEELNLNNTPTQSTFMANLVQAYSQLEPQKLKILKLSGCSELNDYCLKQIIFNGQKLIHLELDMTNLSNKQLREIGKHCFNLRRLSINLTRLVTLEGVKKLQFELPDLKIFRVKGKYHDVQDDGLRMPLVLKSKILKKSSKKKKK